MTTSKGDIDILLFPSVAPRAVANFMAYVNAGDYNGLIFQRLAFASDGITPFVLQTGSLKTLREPRTFSSVLSRPPVLNEPGLSHTEWTIGAAKQGARSSFYTPANSTTQINRGSTLNEQIYGYRGNPNSATTDFFINLGNNSANLDEQNSGFTAFGRIAVPSQATVNAIKALPRGRYLDNNTTNNYNASLDKRIIVDGFATEFGDIPMDVPFPITTGSPPPPADPALSSMDITKTVRISKVTSIPLLTYTATATSSPPGVVSATLTGTTLRLRGLKDNPTPATVTVTARDLDNRTFSTSFNVTVTRGHLAPAITRQPISQTVGTGNTATFNVTATGTGITYRWRKNGNDFNPPEATSTLTIPDALQNSDLYDVVIANDTTFVISNRVRLDTVEAPTLTPDLTHQLVEVGKPLTLTTTITGTPIPVISWKKNGVAFRALSSAQPDGSVITSYKVPLAVLANAGTYEVSAKNSAAVAAAQSTRVNVSVVDKKDTTLQVVPKTVSTKISAPFKGFAAAVDGYVWKKDGVDVRTLGTSFIGGDTAILTIQPETTEDFNSLIHTGRYTCTITLADNVGTVETGAKVLTVVNIPVLPPVLRDNDALVNGFIGVEYTDTLPYSTLSVHTPTSFSFSGLPPGLKFNTTTGVISGKPTRAGIFPFSATARNLAGPSTPTTTGQITIFALPAATVGTLAATISASPALNQNKGGRLNLTTLDTGAFTATVVLGKTTLRAAGSLAAGTGLYNPNNFTYQSRVTIPRTGGLPPLSLVFEIDSDRGYVSGSINDGTESASISGIRQSWNATWNPCLYLTAKSRFINLGLNLDPASGQVGNQGIPQGSGYMTLALSNAGVATITGRLSDGTSITGSSMIGPRGEALFFNMLYANTGSLLSTIDIGDTNLRNTSDLHLRTTGESRWIKDVQPASTRTYQTGIAETFLKIEGIHYYPPAPGTIIMGVANVLTTETNVQMDFSQGGLTASNNNPNIAFRLAANHVATYPIARNAANTFAVTAATGFYSGTFTLTDGRRVTYQGLTIPAIPATPINSNNNGQLVKVEIPGSSAIGAGYFLMPDLVPSLTTSKIYSGRARLLPPALAIATQPSPPTQAVNPGPTTTVTYTVAVTPVQTGITYRWRRNGIDISGATTATLTLSNVAESNQGSYDCVVSNGPTTVTSTAVILNVNDPITAVSASRSPADSVVAVGTKVTFTASAQGTNPNYQWRIN
ncbi:MAG: peptidylprolyl isomerase, partial [Verrucomicrobia bacterium]|nr:peptidylprolyl isomerase [Verrucomicrobiota bacterium]